MRGLREEAQEAARRGAGGKTSPQSQGGAESAEGSREAQSQGGQSAQEKAETQGNERRTTQRQILERQILERQVAERPRRKDGAQNGCRKISYSGKARAIAGKP